MKKKLLSIALAGAVLACMGSAFAARPSVEVVPFALHKPDASPAPVLADANYAESTKLAALADAHKAYTSVPAPDAITLAKGKKPAAGKKSSKSKVAQTDPDPKETRRPGGVNEGLEKLVGS